MNGWAQLNKRIFSLRLVIQKLPRNCTSMGARMGTSGKQANCRRHRMMPKQQPHKYSPGHRAPLRNKTKHQPSTRREKTSPCPRFWTASTVTATMLPRGDQPIFSPHSCLFANQGVYLALREGGEPLFHDGQLFHHLKFPEEFSDSIDWSDNRLATVTHRKDPTCFWVPILVGNEPSTRTRQSQRDVSSRRIRQWGMQSLSMARLGLRGRRQPGCQDLQVWCMF